MNGTLAAPTGTVQETAKFGYLTNGTLLSVTLNGQNSSLYGAIIVEALLVPFDLELDLNSTLGSMTAHLAVVNTTEVTLGPTTMTVTNYNLTQTPITTTNCGFTETIDSAQIQIGSVPGSNFGNLLTYVGFTGSLSGGLSSAAFRVTSIQSSTVVVSTSS
jgi:hypothetical protein